MEALRRGNQDLRWPADYLTPFMGGGVSAAGAHPDGSEWLAVLCKQFVNLGKRLDQVALDIVGERLERGYVEDLSARSVRRSRSCS